MKLNSQSECYLACKSDADTGFDVREGGWVKSSDKIYQLLADGRWFSPGTPASSTTKTDRHHIAEILLKVVLSTKNQIFFFFTHTIFFYNVYSSNWFDSKLNRSPLFP
jgi:hypothetical protein